MPANPNKKPSGTVPRFPKQNVGTPSTPAAPSAPVTSPPQEFAITTPQQAPTQQAAATSLAATTFAGRAKESFANLSPTQQKIAAGAAVLAIAVAGILLARHLTRKEVKITTPSVATTVAEISTGDEDRVEGDWVLPKSPTSQKSTQGEGEFSFVGLTAAQRAAANSAVQKI